MFSNNFQFIQNQLPWPADTLNSEPSGVNQAPYVPNVMCTPDFQNILPLITTTAINAIAATARNSNLRVFTYNQLSENNFQNQNFTNLISLITSYLMYLTYYQNQNPGNLNQFIQLGVDKGLEYQIASNVAQYSGLGQYIDQQTGAYIQNVLSELQQLKPAIQNMAMQLQGNQVGYTNNMMNQRPSFSSGNFGTSNISNAGSAVFQNNPVNQPIQQQQSSVGSVFGSKYGNIKTNEVLPIHHEEPVEKPIQVVTNINKAEEKESATVLMPLTETNLKWVRSDKHPYPPIVKRSTAQLYVKVEEDGTQSYSIGKRSEKSMFDYETHTTLTNFGVRPSTRELPTKESIDNANQKIISVIENGTEIVNEDTEYLPKHKLLCHESIGVEFSIDSIAFEHEIKRDGYIVEEDDEISLFRTEVVLLDNIGVLNEKDTLSLERLKQSETLLELATRLNSVSATMNKRVWRAIERRLTKTVNDVLYLYLSMDLQLDSFVMDIESLIDLLKKEYVAVYDALVRHERNIIKHAISPLSDSPDEFSIRVSINGGDSNANNRFEFLTNHVTMTSVDIDSELLDVELTSHVGNVILPNQSKLLYSLAETVFKEKDNSNPFRLDYLLLNDGVMLRISKGIVGRDYYCISVVN